MKPNIELIDTHCHIHDNEFSSKFDESTDQIIAAANLVGVSKLICVGTGVRSSREAIEFCLKRENCFSSIALHPHEADGKTIDELMEELDALEKLITAEPARLVAIGECGLDYFYHSSEEVREKQKQIFRMQIGLAAKYDLPLIFHIREAFDDFFEIIDDYDNLQGVVHSFSSDIKDLKGVLDRGFYVGFNGIMTFTKVNSQLDAARTAPANRILIETDSPFLTPLPFRGRINEPKHVTNITKFLADLRGESQAFLAKQTSKNAKILFNL